MNRWRFLLLSTLTVVVCLGTWFARGALLAQEKPAPAGPAVVWEYKIIWQPDVSRIGVPDIKLENALVNYDAVRKGIDKLAAEGWELVAVESSLGNPIYYFKRPRPAK